MSNKPSFTSSNYIVIQGWMITELGLRAAEEIVVYAAIYGFSQSENQWYTSGWDYLMGLAKISKPTLSKYLKNMLEKGLIECRKNGTESWYRVAKNGADQEGEKVKEFNQLGKETLPSKVKELNQLGKETLPIDDNIRNNNIYNNTPYTPYYTTLRMECSPQGEPPPTHNEKESGKNEEKPKKKNGFIPPTLDEVIAYCESRGNKVDPHRFFDYYAAADWVDSKGDKVRNWKQKCITWERHDDRDAPTVNARMPQTSNAQVPVPPALSESELDELFGFEMPGKNKT